MCATFWSFYPEYPYFGAYTQIILTQKFNSEEICMDNEIQAAFSYRRTGTFCIGCGGVRPIPVVLKEELGGTISLN